MDMAGSYIVEASREAVRAALNDPQVLTQGLHSRLSGKDGARLIDGVARKTADEFFGNFARHVGAQPAAGQQEVSHG